MAEHFLDVSHLPPPEPLEMTWHAAMRLKPGERLRVRVPRQPYPLFGLLAENGFTYESTPVPAGVDVVYDVVITRDLCRTS
ncbi:MAG TPA: DUF2249 domain-containing protein [Acidiferrobacter sp.]|nr:DUF2249 domain-containing protein [Acidiferrobacter sp.]